MQYVIYVILLLTVLGLVICLKKKENQINVLRQQLEEAQDRMKTSSVKKNELEKIRNKIWDFGNIIYLYTALCEEETGNPSLKEKQREIMGAAEEILQLTNNELKKED